jgi:hypothetical protein
VSRNTCLNLLSVWFSLTWSALQVAKLFADAGIIALVSFISPYRADRDAVRARLPPGRFVEVYMKVRENGVCRWWRATGAGAVLVAQVTIATQT